MGYMKNQNVGNIDLHVHSTYSDGIMAPEALLANAEEQGLKVIAITDHDSVEGIQKCFEQPRNITVSLIPGIELTARNDRELHIIGLFIDPFNDELNSYTQRIKILKMRLYAQAFSILRTKGIRLDLHKLQQQCPHPSLTSLRNFVLDYYTAIASQDIDRWLSPLYCAWQNGIAMPEKCIQIIHRANGVAVLAHPGRISLEESEVYNVIERLARQGLNGIECLHPYHTEIQIEKYKQIADDFRMFITGGSDFHGHGDGEMIGYYSVNKRIPFSLISEIVKNF